MPLRNTSKVTRLWQAEPQQSHMSQNRSFVLLPLAYSSTVQVSAERPGQCAMIEAWVVPSAEDVVTPHWSAPPAQAGS